MDQNAPVAIVLGGTSPHAALCSRLKNRGYYTILADYLEHPPAKDYADEHIRESTLDHEAVLNLACEKRASLVIASCIDQANITACYVLEKINKHFPYSYDTALKVSNKIIMKSIMMENSIPTSKFVKITDLESSDWKQLKFPLIVKPADSNGSKGVRRCDNENELIHHLASAIKISRTSQAVVEEFIEGREIAFDSYVFNGKANIVITRERRKIPGTGDSIQQIYGSFWPASLDSKSEQRLIAIGNQIAKSFGLDNTPLMVQAIISGDHISVIEFAPRIGGGENHRIIKMATGFDLIEASIDSFLGNTPNIQFHTPKKIFLDNYLYSTPCVFDCIDGLEKLLEEGFISEFQVYKKKGTVIGECISSNNRIASFIVSADSEEECVRRIRDAVERIEIFDTSGSKVMIREIY
jgi:biotin carboxylase